MERDRAEQRQLRGAQPLLGQRRGRRTPGRSPGATGRRGITGAVSAANSLVGSTAGDQVGYDGVTALSNGNYVVSSPDWDNGAVGERRGGHLGQWDDRHHRRGLGRQQPGGQHSR